MKIIALTADETKTLATAQQAVTAAQTALGTAQATYTGAYNTILAGHKLDTGPSSVTLSDDGLYLIVP
jgi:hypothetical protein